ncbi:MAG: homoserine kinase [Thermoanaerobaculia bacterium]|nr:homoserine kinase [Thermoanaerobaculia bacterium]
MSQVTVFAPSTVSNVACGFDILGFALEGAGDRVTATLRDRPGVSITDIQGDGGLLPRQVHLNTAGLAVQTLLEGVSESRRGIDLEIVKGTPAASGLGSSAASSVAAVVAANELLGLGLSHEQLLPASLEGERIASGGVLHGDNVAPCLYGGFVLVRSLDPPDVIQIPVPEGLTCGILRPHVEIKTSESRALLGGAIPLGTAVVQWANVAGLIHGLHSCDWSLISRSLHDVVAEPVRGHQVPGFHEIQEAALAAGALGCSLSGSGPAIFALCRGRDAAEVAVAAMQDALVRATGLASDRFVSAVGGPGAPVVD